MRRKRPRYPVLYEYVPPEGYSEKGSEYGARLGEADETTPEYRRMQEATREMTPGQLVSWLDEHPLPDCRVVDTDDAALLGQGASQPRTLFLTRALESVRHLNTLLYAANALLPDGGTLWCRCRTAGLHKEAIFKTYPPVINGIVFFFHYLWHRVCPRLKLTRGLYFALTKGRCRDLHRVEFLGRLYRAGFEVVDEEFRGGEFFITARKVKAPAQDLAPGVPR